MRIKVLHVVDQLEYGGAAMAVKNIVENMDEERVETFVCALRRKPKTVPIKAKVVTLRCHKYSPFAVLAIVRLCKQYSIDIMHAHLLKSITSSLLASFLCKSKVIIHDHGGIFRSDWVVFVYKLSLKVLGSRASLVIANSHATKMTLYQRVGFSEESIMVVSNFIDFARFDYTSYDPSKVRYKLGFSDNQLIIGFVGRLFFYKGVDLLINAASVICEKNSRLRFVIVGDGPQRRKLEQQVAQLGLEKKVIFTGLCKNPAEIMRAFDIAVIPSREEAFGIVAVELMRMMIPVIISPIGGLPELAQHGETGILLNELSKEAIAEAVIRLAKDRALRERLIKNAEVFSRKFDGRLQIEQLRDIYESLAQGRL
ncbi:MAG: glycosyltransferase family 4 protein [Deltaproteobacteria bacterium]|nr:glycosyltransferase family 4 protein [Deltaproteobacteria bacterium]